MSTYAMILLVLSFGILLFALGYTLAVARSQKVLKAETDSSLPHKVQSHIYLRNPVFLSYGIFFLLVILFILYFALKT